MPIKVTFKFEFKGEDYEVGEQEIKCPHAYRHAIRYGFGNAIDEIKEDKPVKTKGRKKKAK